MESDFSDGFSMYRMFNISEEDKFLFNSLVDLIIKDKNKEINVKLLEVYAGVYDYPHKNELMAASAFHGAQKTFSLLLKNKANPRVYGDLSLRLASEMGYVKLVKKLVKLGSDVTAMNNFALRVAIKKDKFDVAEFLLECGSDPHDMGGQAFKSAANLPNGEIKVLLDKFIYEKNIVPIEKNNNVRLKV